MLSSAPESPPTSAQPPSERAVCVPDGELTIAAREGRFPGMLTIRTFRLVLVSPDTAVGVIAEAPAARARRFMGAISM